MKNTIKILIISLIVAFAIQTNAYVNPVLKTIHSISKISRHPNTFSNKGIKNLSELSAKELGVYLGGKKLSHQVLEDTFIRIAIFKKVIHRREAEGLFTRLSGTPGFATTLKKIIGNNPSGTKGHLNELQIADNASISGFKVLGIGEKFKDPVKKALTDIDIVLQKNGRTFIIEAKAYDKTNINKINYRKDLDTLVAYKKQNKDSDIVPIFSFTKIPSSATEFKLLKHEAKRRDVELIFGEPYEQVEKIKILNKIL